MNAPPTGAVKAEYRDARFQRSHHHYFNYRTCTQACSGEELIVIEDRSTDGTWNELQKIAAHSKVKLLRHLLNRGKGAVLRSGFASATASVVVIQDADLEYDPDDLPVMSRAMEGVNADVVYGSRFAKAAEPETQW
jgi:glycosyltransferase involved in cell wall biosynthesis